MIPTIPDWLEDIGAFLTSNGFGQVGTAVFYLDFKASVPNCIAITDLPGGQDDVTLDGNSILFKPQLNIRIRNTSPKTAKTTAKNLFNSLNLITNRYIGSTYFKRIVGIDKPFFVSKSNTEGAIYSINFSLELE